MRAWSEYEKAAIRAVLTSCQKAGRDLACLHFGTNTTLVPLIAVKSLTADSDLKNDNQVVSRAAISHCRRSSPPCHPSSRQLVSIATGQSNVAKKPR